jgi:hypothetical protein
MPARSVVSRSTSFISAAVRIFMAGNSWKIKLHRKQECRFAHLSQK